MHMHILLVETLLAAYSRVVLCRSVIGRVYRCYVIHPNISLCFVFS